MNSLFRSGIWLRSFRAVLVATLCAVVVPLRAALDAPVTPGAQPAVGELLTFLDQTSGNYIIAGQQEIAWDLSREEEDFSYIIATTGRSPAVRGFDFLMYVYNPAVRANQDATERAIAWAQRGGIVNFCCHMFMDIGSTNGSPQFYVPAANNGVGTTFDIRQAVISGTPENTEFIAKLDIIANELTKLRDAGVPVIWRPFHECSGGWFWWGAHGPDACKQAYRIMFDRFTRVCGLNNLIWVYNPTDSTTNMAAWYPGDDVVDIISLDVYPPAGTHPTFAADYAQMRAFKNDRKVVTMSENGAIPDPDQLFSTSANAAGWPYFCTWNGFENDTSRNSVTFLNTVYNHPKVITLDELPAFYDAFPLAFTAQPPAAPTVTVGHNVSFTVSATGSPAPAYRWQVSTDSGSAWTNLAETAPYSGTTTGTLTITGATTAMNGCQYRCVASNGMRPDATSNVATLTVIPADQGFLQHLFPLVLGRQIDPGALSAYLAAMAGGRSRTEVLGDLLGSSEYSARQVEPSIRLYYAALARPPEYAGLQNWSNALHAGMLTLTEAADQFAGSTEFLLRYGSLDNTEYVQQLYRNVLGREADQAGLDDWVGRLTAGASRGAVLVGFSESDEFKHNLAGEVEVLRLYFLLLQRMPTTAELQDRIGFLKGYDQTDAIYLQGYPSGLSNASYVTLVFQGFLRRTVDAGALSTYAAALAAGTVTHGSLVETVMNSDEFNLFVAPVSRLYLAALRRVPDQPGLNNWVNYVRGGASLQVMADAFAASQEFINRYGAMNNGEYVAQLYRDVLGREADPDGLAHWTGLLDSGGTTRGQILIGFSESQEAIHLFAPTLRTFLHFFTFLNSTPTQAELDYWKNNLATLTEQFRETMLADPGFTNGE